MMRVSDGLRPPKVLILSSAFPPENLPGAARPYRFYRYLPEYGYEPLVLTASAQDPEHVNGNVTHVADLTQASPRRSPRRLLEAAICRTIRPGEAGSLWMLDAFRAADRLLVTGSISALYSTFPALNVHLVAMALKRRYRLPWIADFRDPLVDNPFFPHNRLSNWFDRLIERRIFSEADAVIGVTDAIAGQWRDRYPEHAHKIHVLWNGFDPDRPVRPLPIPARPYRVLAHIGSFYGGRTPAAILGSIRRLIDSGHLDPSKFRLRFVGDYGEGFFTPQTRSAFESIAKAGCLEYEDRLVPRAEALRIMGESDYLYLADNSSLEFGYTVPAKLYEYVQIGRPILATTSSNSPVDRILKKSGIPTMTIGGDMDEQEVDRRLLEFLQLPSDPVTAPSSWFRDNFDGRLQTGTLAGLLNSIVLKSIVSNSIDDAAPPG